MAVSAREGFIARPRSSTGAPARLARVAVRASVRAARATQTGRPTGARGASSDPCRAQGRRCVVPGNTLASFDAALAAGVDMIEFDVLSERPDGSGELLVVHDYRALAPARRTDARRGARPPVLGAVRGNQAPARPQASGLRGAASLDALDGCGRAFARLLQHGRVEQPRCACERSRRGLPSAGRSARRGRRADRRRARRADLPDRISARARARLRDGEIDALVVHWPLVSRRLVAPVLDAGGEIYVWTVDDFARIARACGARCQRSDLERPAPVRSADRADAPRCNPAAAPPALGRRPLLVKRTTLRDYARSAAPLEIDDAAQHGPRRPSTPRAGSRSRLVG